MSPAGRIALQFLHETGGWTDDDPKECRIHHNTLRSFEERGWITCDHDNTGRITACTTTIAGHEACQVLLEKGEPDPNCHGCDFHYSRLKKAAENVAAPAVV